MRRRTWWVAALAAMAAAGAVPAASSASASTVLRTPTAGMCESAPLSQPFARWGDRSSYRLAPGGSFSEGAPGWSLTGGARIVGTDDPFNLAGAATPASLSLPAGATAQSPFLCVDGTQPTFRFVHAGAVLGSGLQVSVVYQTLTGQVVTAPVGVLNAQLAWAPSVILQTGAQVAAATAGGSARMALRFTDISGSARIDDVFIDPRMHGP